MSQPLEQPILWLKKNARNAVGTQLTSLPPLALYIHFPWCEKKCPYCDFNSHQAPAQDQFASQEARYIDALILDLEHSLPLVWGRRIRSIFIGGGTPSLISGAGLDYLLAAVRARIPMDADIEITLEANPGSVESENFAAYAASGVNRISLGIQSFNDQHLSRLGRIHRADEARKAITLAKQYFPKVNIDLMYALPDQTVEEALADLEEALSFDTGHLSLYHLTIEPNTYFAKFPPSIPDEDTAYDMQDKLLETLQIAGYGRYEISAFAKPNARCQHNLNYWAFGDYLGIGAGAHGKVSSAQQILRTVKERHPETYLKDIYSPSKALIEERVVQGSELPFEFMLNALRLIDGVPSHYFSDRTGIELTHIMSAINDAIEKNLLDSNLNQLKATPLGLQFLNDLQEIFLDEPDLEN